MHYMYSYILCMFIFIAKKMYCNFCSLWSNYFQSEKLENACVKCQIWICISHFLLTTLATELFILGFNLIRPGATSEQTVTFSIATVICLLKTGFRIFAERSVKEYLRDIYSVPVNYMQLNLFLEEIFLVFHTRSFIYYISC